MRDLAEALGGHLRQLGTIEAAKKSYLRSISHRVGDLLGLFTDFPTLSVRELHHMLDNPSAVRLLALNKKYLTLQDLCAYLGATEHQADLQAQGKNSLTTQHRFDFEDLVARQAEVMDGIREAIRKVRVEDLFSEVDFFSNGYIDAGSLREFLHHQASSIINSSEVSFNQKQQRDEETDLILLSRAIKYLKGTVSAHKIFQADLVQILQEADKSSAEQGLPNSSVQNLSSFAGSRSVGHIARVSDLEAMQSRSRRSRHQFQLEPKLSFGLDNQSQPFKFELDQLEIPTVSKITEQDLSRINQNLTNELQPNNYERRICESHSRNARYLEKLRLQMGQRKASHAKNMPSASSIKQIADKTRVIQTPDGLKSLIQRKAEQKFYHSIAPLKQRTKIAEASSSEVMYQMRYLGQIYEKFKSTVENFLTQNHSFTFVNGFNVIDLADNGYVTYKQLKQFLYETDTLLHESKVRIFYQALVGIPCAQQQQTSLEAKLSYAMYVQKIFHLRHLVKLVQSCRRKKPLVLQQWPRQQQLNYCRFIRSVASLFNQIYVAKSTLIRMLSFDVLQKEQRDTAKITSSIRDKIEEVFKEADIHRQKLQEMLGVNSAVLVQELYSGEVVLEPETFRKFLYTIV